MSRLDYVILGIVVVSALIGVLRGLIREALSLVIWALALWAAGRYGALAAAAFTGHLADPSLQLWAGRLAVFIAVLFAGSLVAWLIVYLAHRTAITGTDRILGMLFGVARGVVVVGIVVLGLEIGGFAAEPWWRESKLIPYAAAVGADLRDLAERQFSGREGVQL